MERKAPGCLKKACAVLLALLFTGHLMSVTLFFHTHIVDGVKVAHSHPYKGTPGSPCHSHSKAQLALISQLSALLMLAGFMLLSIAPRFGWRIAPLIRRQHTVPPYFVYISRQWRAPPATAAFAV